MNNQQISYFKRALVMLMAVMMVFTYMPGGTWGGVETAWADAAFSVTDITYTDRINSPFTSRDTYTSSSNTFNIVVDEQATTSMITLNVTAEGSLTNDNGNTLYAGIFDSNDTHKVNSAFKASSDNTNTMRASLGGSSWITNKLGTKATYTLVVGYVNTSNKNNPKTKGNYDDSKEFTINVTRSATLKTFTVQTENGETTTNRNLTPSFSTMKPSNQYTVEVPWNTTKIKLGLTPKTPKLTDIYIGGSNVKADADSDGLYIVENNFEAGDETAEIPIELKYNNEEGGNGANSKYTLTVKKAYPPSITEQPETSVQCDKNENVTVSVEATAPQGKEGILSYQWYWSGDRVIEGATDSTLTIPTEYSYRESVYCKVTNTVGDKAYSVNSNNCLITVNPTTINTPVVSTPTGADTCKIGETVKLSAEESHTDTYGIKTDKMICEWYRNTKDSTEGGEKIGESALSLNADKYKTEFEIPTEMTTGTYYYYCKVTLESNLEGLEASATGVSAGTKSVTYEGYSKEIAGLKGAGTEANPYQIESDTQLVAIKNLVNGVGEKAYSFKNIYFKLTSDITLPADWIPMGCLKNQTDGKGVERGENLNAFSGNLDGGSHTITVPENGKPLLGYVWNASVKNLKISGKKIDGYGLVNNYTGINLDGYGIIIDNVRVLKGTQITESGLLGASKKELYAGASAVFTSTIKNCTIEEGVTIGSETTDAVGSIAGRFHGTIENCVSYANVTGRNYVGGILGTCDNALGNCTVKNCKFYGTVNGQKNVGGIVGGGYGYGGYGDGTECVETASAPNGLKINILSCAVGKTASITGTENVGGILGGDPYVAQAWDAYSFVGNSFAGTISGKTNVGGIIGYCRSLNKSDNIAGNYYTKNCGASKGIGLAELVDTNKYANLTVENGTTYINTSNAKVEAKSDSTMGENTLYLNTAAGYVEGPSVIGCNWKLNYNRTDDPLGEDADKLAKAVDTIPTEAFCYELIADKEYVETYVGDELNLSKLGVTFTAKWTNNKADTTVDAKDIKVTGYNKNSHSVQTVTLTYGYAVTTIQVAVKQKSEVVKKDKLTVNFKLLGDSQHDSDTDKKVHGLATGGLTTWTSGTYTVPLNSTVWDLMKNYVATSGSGITFNAKGTQYGTYIYSVTYNGTELGEFDNGKNSGWMYTVNGTHPEVAVGARFLNDGDTVVFHYTDDYTKEEGSEKWNSGTKTEETKTVTTDTKSGTVTTPTETKVTEKTNADGTKEKTATVTVSTDNQTEIIKQATDKKSTEIVLEVASTATGGAQNVQLQLNVSFVKNVSEKTDAALTVNTENGTVSLDQDTIKTVLDEAKGATITLDVNKVANPTEVQKKAAGTNGQILSLTVKSGDKTISDFKTGKVTVTVAISTALQNKRVAAIHIAEDGKIQQMPGKSREINGKKCFEFTTSHFSDFALVDADELGLETEDEIDAAALVAKLTPVARSAKTAKGNIKVTTSLDKSDKAIISDLKDAGYTVKYRFYRSIKKAAGYKSTVTKKASTYTNTTGKKGTKYFYKVQVRVYDASGKLAAKTALKQCKYACRIK